MLEPHSIDISLKTKQCAEKYTRFTTFNIAFSNSNNFK